jgi:hypothetical protein
VKQCPRCKKYRWDHCTCQLFQCAEPWHDEPTESDWQDVYANDAETAAEVFAERSDCEGDYTIIRNGEAVIWVRDVENKVTVFEIEAESVPHYTARERVTTR